MQIHQNLKSRNRTVHQKSFKIQLIRSVKFYIINSINYTFFMEYQVKLSNKPKNYAKIPLNKRIKLVDLVNQQSFSIAKASKKLSIKLSTAKLILKKYKEDGTFFEKRTDRLTRIAATKGTQEFTQPIPHQQHPAHGEVVFQSTQNERIMPISQGQCFYGDQFYMLMDASNGLYYNNFVGMNNLACLPYGGLPYYY